MRWQFSPEAGYALRYLIGTLTLTVQQVQHCCQQAFATIPAHVVADLIEILMARHILTTDD